MKTIAAIHIAENHPAFPGHFPGNPIVPGVVLLDRALQAIAAMTGISFGHCVLSSVKFKHVVLPGEPLTLSYEFPAPHKLHFEIHSVDNLIATGRLVLQAASDGR
jgi:3-hydroxyacyl-[acyl-carrier-protein] dehydratase